MEKYKLVFKRTVAKDLRSLPKKDVGIILKCVRALADNPRPMGCEKLSGQERYRIRQGIYRVIYEIQDKVLKILAVKIAHRREVYK